MNPTPDSASLLKAAGDETNAAIERSESEKYSAMEQRYLPLFDRIYVCSEHDRQAIARHHGCSNVTTIPNGVRIPRAEATGPKISPFTFLFVGSLGYYPNEDAVLFFCAEVLPQLRAIAGRNFRVHIVGTHPSRQLMALSHPEVTVIGAVPDVADYYRAADVVIIPLRAGGGTRIKLLEAFSYRRPVVSTALGTEGNEVRHGVHLLIADTPGDLAQQCLRLMQTRALGAELAGQAFEFVRYNHSLERIRDLLRQDHRA